jgi:hypothetical protein
MLKKKMFLVAATALMAFSLAACNTTTGGTDQDYEQSDTTGEDLVVSVAGSATPAGWDTVASSKNKDCLFTKVDGKHYQLKDFVLAKANSEGDYQGFKVHLGTTWAGQYGVEDFDWTKSTGLTDLLGEGKTAADYKGPSDNRSNIEPAKAGKITIDFYPYYFLDTTVSSNFLVISFTANV